PDAFVEQIADEAVGRTGQADPLVLRQVLLTLAPFVAERLGGQHRASLNVLAALANLERELGDRGDPEIREGAILRVIAVSDSEGRAPDAIHAVMGLAAAQGEAGRHDEAVSTYRDAVARAERLGQPVLLSQV